AADVPLVRIHSQCFTSEVLGSPRCDCAGQLDLAMQAIVTEGRGVVIYEHQEGRGIGLMAKLNAYALQDERGIDTIEANRVLGYEPDCRDFGLPAAILQALGVSCVRLLSNNPRKAHALLDAGVEVAERIPCEAAPTVQSSTYMRTKKERMGHTLSSVGVGDEIELASIETAIEELQAGRMVVVIDDEDRENEGDLTMAAELVTPEA